ncbi:uncharacterized protein LOC135488571 [Lineus longissimus]|uniref:uncharacterized protein LOC135488571 n=1 Tax=Lineus longissimus TaxID=88925 RepID=UPI00315D48F8
MAERSNTGNRVFPGSAAGTYIHDTQSGFTINMEPSLCQENEDFTHQWQSILKDTSSRLMVLLLRNLDETIHQFEMDLETAKANLQTSHKTPDVEAPAGEDLPRNNPKSNSQKTSEEPPQEEAEDQGQPPETQPGHCNKETKQATTSAHNDHDKVKDKGTISVSKGLNFCPAPPTYDNYQLNQDFEEYFRRIRLKEFFAQTEPDWQDPLQTDLGFRLKSSWTPPPVGNANLETYIATTSMTLNKAKANKHRDNISKEERNALQSLRNNQEITIKRADKGGATVILNTKDYISECERQLTDTNFYSKQDTNLTKRHELMTQHLVDHMKDKNIIDEKTYKFLYPSNSRTPNFYCLPKIHKKGNPGRPIVSGNNSCTENLSKYVDSHLRPLVETLSTYIRDTADFLNKLKEIKLDPQEHQKHKPLLVTLDVKSLYTNIPHNEGLAAMGNYLDKRTKKSVPTGILVQAAELILKTKRHNIQ